MQEANIILLSLFSNQVKKGYWIGKRVRGIERVYGKNREEYGVGQGWGARGREMETSEEKKKCTQKNMLSKKRKTTAATAQ